MLSPTGLSPSLVDLSRYVRLASDRRIFGPTTPPTDGRRFGLVPVRSPLLRKSLLISFPGGTEMFHFPPLATHAYVFSVRQFRNPGFKACLAARPGLSQPSTPFIAFWRQDIPHAPLVAWPRRFIPPAQNTEGPNRYASAFSGSCPPTQAPNRTRSEKERTSGSFLRATSKKFFAAEPVGPASSKKLLPIIATELSKSDSSTDCANAIRKPPANNGNDYPDPWTVILVIDCTPVLADARCRRHPRDVHKV